MCIGSIDVVLRYFYARTIVYVRPTCLVAATSATVEHLNVTTPTLSFQLCWKRSRPGDTLPVALDPYTAALEPCTVALDPYTAARGPYSAALDPYSVALDHFSLARDPFSVP